MSTPFEDETRMGLARIDEWMNDLVVGDPESQFEHLDHCLGPAWGGDWRAGTKAAVLAVLERCLPRDFEMSRSGAEVKPANSDATEDHRPTWMAFWAGDYVHMVAKLDTDHFGLGLHRGGSWFEEGMEKPAGAARPVDETVYAYLAVERVTPAEHGDAKVERGWLDAACWDFESHCFIAPGHCEPQESRDDVEPLIIYGADAPDLPDVVRTVLLNFGPFRDNGYGTFSGLSETPADPETGQTIASYTLHFIAEGDASVSYRERGWHPSEIGVTDSQPQSPPDAPHEVQEEPHADSGAERRTRSEGRLLRRLLGRPR